MYLRSEVLMAKMLSVIFWVVMLCGLVGGYQFFEGKMAPSS
jgi:nitrate reductase NapE component